MSQELEGPLHSEINILGYPKAALFGFCVALVAYNVLAVVLNKTNHNDMEIKKAA
jgi:hypothetical protein